jgi:SAM-dependent methyltransferase
MAHGLGLLWLMVPCAPFDMKEYVRLQRTKMEDLPDLVAMRDKGTEAEVYGYLDHEIKKGSMQLRQKTALCVGARGGGEVRAMIRLGAFAVGVDLHPVNSTLVLQGDGMTLAQFGDGTVDIVFTNVLDHIPFLKKFAESVYRVLKPNGLLISSVFIQTMDKDKWAVRDTGTPAFFTLYDRILKDVGFVERSRERVKPRQSKMHILSMRGT